MSSTMTVEQARELLLQHVKVMDVERVDLLDSLGRVLAQDMASDIDVAPFDNSAMDGFAVRAADLNGASEQTPARVRIIEHIAAGDYPELEVGPGEASRIMTGAPMPLGADAVVMVEYSSVIEGDGAIDSLVALSRAVAEGENVRRRGEEVRAGDVVLNRGESIGPAGLGLLASTGHAKVSVYRRPRVAVLSTGSELVEVDQVPGPGKIRNSNSYSVAAQVIAAGGIPVRYDIVPDDMQATREAFTHAAANSDFIVTTGGVSVGDFDYVKPVLQELGELMYCKVTMRPGNPQTMGMIDETPFFGLPGNPTSTYVGFEMFVRPAIRYMLGHTELDRPIVRARLAHDVRKKPDRRYFMRGVVSRAEDGLEVALSGNQSSALLMSVHKGNCFVVLPEGEREFSAGQIVDCIRLDIDEGIQL
ncbi:MAG: molybdopterin molybdotransferase MoeA [Actinomycetota bacterium]|jgi:molybdopterin molybdotransferase|nr:molybdopterin molybdotransferase MoeA [Actinomycetota bacterium]